MTAVTAGRATHVLRARRIADGAARALPFVAPAIIVGAGSVVIWSHFMVLTQGFWGDEVRAITTWDHGPGTIWDPARYIPGDHVLYQFLSWATTSILGSHAEATYRIWSVFPAIAAGGLMVWWLWRRFDRSTAAAFAVLVAANPMYYELAPQARGYGIAFLAAALVVIGADGMVRSDSDRWTALFAIGGFIGMATLVNFVGFFLGTAVVLMFIPRCRRRTVIAVLATGVASALWYAPLLSAMLNYHQARNFGHVLPWHGFVTAPLRDLVGAEFSVQLPGVSASAGAIFAAVVIAGAIVLLWRGRRSSTALVLVIPVLVSYLVITVATKYSTRFGSFAVMPMLALVAIGLVGPGRLLGRIWRPGAPAMLLVLAVASILALGRFAHWSANVSALPIESGKIAAQIVNSVVGPNVPVWSNGNPGPFAYYSSRPVHGRPPNAELARVHLVLLHKMFCRYRLEFVYVWDPKLRAPDTSCLTNRHAIKLMVPQQRSPGSTTIWLVPHESVSAATNAPATQSAGPLRGGHHR